MRIVVVAGGLWGLGLGCVAGDGESLEGGDEELVDRIGAMEALCNERVHVALRATGCADVGSWNGEQLFDVGPLADAASLGGALGQYCRYTWAGPGEPTSTSVNDLYATVGSTASPSCQGVAGQMDVLTDALAPALRGVFRAGVGWVSPAELHRPTGSGNPTVTVLVVDTQPTSIEVEPTSSHGKHMVNIISDIACPEQDPSCGVELLLEVGLPRLANGETNYAEGGYVGTHVDLAVAIYRGVRRWEQANQTRPADPSHLVINLSVGWDPELFIEGDPSFPKATIGAVRAALEHASCKGALIIASAGNAGLELDPQEGPLMPAGWETRPAPNQARCTALGVPTGGNPPGSYRPLVHAVGGLGIDWGPMSIRRPEANPRLMAAASHEVAGVPLNGGITGTSVATAVTSGVAALVWSHRDDLAAHQVMDLVYAGGRPLPTGMITDFGLVSPSPAPRRVHACAALFAACAGAGDHCPATSCLTQQVPTATDFAVQLAGAYAAPPVAVVMPVDQLTCDVGEGSISVHATSDGAECEMFTMEPTEHLVNPTPESIGCPTCTITVQNGVLSLSTHQYYDGISGERVLVTLKDDLGGLYYYDLGALELSSSTIKKLTLEPSKLPTRPVRSGQIAIDFGGTVTTKDPLLVL